MLCRGLCGGYAPTYAVMLLLLSMLQCVVKGTQEDVSFWEGVDTVMQQDRKDGGYSTQPCRHKYYFMFKVGDEKAGHMPSPERVRVPFAEAIIFILYCHYHTMYMSCSHTQVLTRGFCRICPFYMPPATSLLGEKRFSRQ